MPLNSRTTRARGYTLIEIFVCGMIVMLLGAIIFPAFNKARQQAALASCTSQLRQVGQGLMLYDLDHDNSLENYPDRVTHLVQLQYVTDERAFVCPADRTKATGAGLKPGTAADDKAEWAERNRQSVDESGQPILTSGGKPLYEKNSSYLYEFSTRECVSWWEDCLVYWDGDDVWSPSLEDVDRDGDGKVTWQEAKFWQMENGDVYCTGWSWPGTDGIPEELANMANAYDMIDSGQATKQRGYPRSWLPMLRCFWHQNPDAVDDERVEEVLNLAVDGNVFHSSPFWENTAFKYGRSWQQDDEPPEP